MIVIERILLIRLIFLQCSFLTRLRTRLFGRVIGCDHRRVDAVATVLTKVTAICSRGGPELATLAPDLTFSSIAWLSVHGLTRWWHGTTHDHGVEVGTRQARRIFKGSSNYIVPLCRRLVYRLLSSFSSFSLRLVALSVNR